jgi:hypothetical protein
MLDRIVNLLDRKINIIKMDRLEGILPLYVEF